jgi:hypothetical protein
VPVTSRRGLRTAEQCSRWRTGPTRPGRLTGGSDATTRSPRSPAFAGQRPGATFSPAAAATFLNSRDDGARVPRNLVITLERQEVERVISVEGRFG